MQEPQDSENIFSLSPSEFFSLSENAKKRILNLKGERIIGPIVENGVEHSLYLIFKFLVEGLKSTDNQHIENYVEIKSSEKLAKYTPFINIESQNGLLVILGNTPNESVNAPKKEKLKPANPLNMENKMTETRILIVDDHLIIRTGLELMLLNKNPDYVIVHANTAKEALGQLKKNKFDLVVLDLNLPDSDSTTTLEKVMATRPKQKVLVFSMNPESLFAKRCISLGALGYLSKTSDEETIMSAISKVLSGKMYLSQEYIENILIDSVGNDESDIFKRLTKREFQLMQILATGKPLKTIAEELNLQSSTVGTFKKRILSKLKVENVLELKELMKSNGIMS